LPKHPDPKAFPELAERQRALLAAVVQEYIATAEPVASGQLVRRYTLDVSSATVRSELATLEELGLLTHPHTSSGRVPTDLGYRYFIESLMPRPGLRPDEQLTVSHQFGQATSDTSEWLRLAASILARLTAEASIVTPLGAKRAALRHVEAVPIQERRVLVIAVLEGGTVRQQLVELREPVAPERLRLLSARLTRTLAGADGGRVRAAQDAESGGEKEVVATLARIVADYDSSRAHDVYFDGFQNILAQPEFAERERTREMLRLLEDRTRLAEILPGDLGAGEVHVAIGSEHRLALLRDCSLVFGRYGSGPDAVGLVGIVGPTRMDYARSIGAVRYVGSLMSDLVRVMEGH